MGKIVVSKERHSNREGPRGTLSDQLCDRGKAAVVVGLVAGKFTLDFHKVTVLPCDRAKSCCEVVVDGIGIKYVRLVGLQRDIQN